MSTVLADVQAAGDASGRLQQIVAARANLAEQATPAQLYDMLDGTHSAIKRDFDNFPTDGVNPADLIAAGRGIVRRVAEARGYSQVAVFGSVARGVAREDSDIDLLVQPPAHTSLFDLGYLHALFVAILGCPVDLISYGGLKPGMDDDILSDAVLL